jgi:hypothetical protein
LFTPIGTRPDGNAEKVAAITPAAVETSINMPGAFSQLGSAENLPVPSPRCPIADGMCAGPETISMAVLRVPDIIHGRVLA